MKYTISGIIFITIWIVIMLLWSGNTKTPDLSDRNLERMSSDPCFENGHPLWTDC